MMEILGYRKVCSRWVPRLFTGTEEKKTAGNCFPIDPAIQIWAPQVTTFSGHWQTTITRMTRQSRRPCEAGCKELERISTAKGLLGFWNASRNA
jgi:hypothetical protein